MTNKQSWTDKISDMFEFDISYSKQRGWKRMADKMENSKLAIIEFINQLLTSKAEQMEREKFKEDVAVRPETRDGFNAGISKCIEVLKR